MPPSGHCLCVFTSPYGWYKTAHHIALLSVTWQSSSSVHTISFIKSPLLISVNFRQILSFTRDMIAMDDGPHCTRSYCQYTHTISILYTFVKIIIFLLCVFLVTGQLHSPTIESDNTSNGNPRILPVNRNELDHQNQRQRLQRQVSAPILGSANSSTTTNTSTTSTAFTVASSMLLLQTQVSTQVHLIIEIIIIQSWFINDWVFSLSF